MVIAATEQKQTRASSIYLLLRNDILNGAMLPGTKLNIRDLCEHYSSGLSPMREALNRLSAEGLAQQLDNRGFKVQPVSVPELMDLTQARCWVNEICVRKSVEKGDGDWEESVLLTCHRLSRTPRDLAEGDSRPNPDWVTAHKAFHQALISACGSNWMIDTCSQLFDAAERYRNLARVAGVSRSDPRDEHQEIMNAAVNRQADLVVELLNSHFERTAHLVRSVVSQTEADAE
ncbi:transcriptional regulator [Hoeflea sp. IMCC20628]|uniref:GntR family transcriptional regulator n=1 Tax=Hoeflea sp. IMCC20628 TaxID=1620421 RepID=UPI00063AD956|nr:FCD domain-containing protein [Hoeflea sp. IMCC20628]AKI01937.1 transcriptional regulator [Hoeflea sp. IMCC20628]